MIKKKQITVNMEFVMSSPIDSLENEVRLSEFLFFNMLCNFLKHDVTFLPEALAIKGMR